MTNDEIRELIEFHLERYPESRITDVYRLLHQAVFGPSHAISDRESTQEWLEHEFEIYPPNAEEPLFDPICNDQIRLNLRPYKAAGGALAPLLDALMAAGRSEVTPEQREGMKRGWEVFSEMVSVSPQLQERFRLREVQLFGRVYEKRVWAMSQHSPEYIYAYRPVYRVLPIQAAKELCKAQNISLEL